MTTLGRIEQLGHPDVLVQEIINDLETALDQFSAVVGLRWWKFRTGVCDDK